MMKNPAKTLLIKSPILNAKNMNGVNSSAKRRIRKN
jgi:hypothetical protein